LHSSNALLPDTLRSNLHDVHLPVNTLVCHNINCSDTTHIASLYKFVDDISNTCLSAADSTLPHTSRCGSEGRIPGWTEVVAPARDKSIMWHRIWVDCGRPRNGIVADIMRKTRTAYHYAIRKARRNADDIVNERFAEGLLGDNGRDLWAEAKKIRHSKSGISSVVDSINTAEGIADLFASKYQDLYTSVACDPCGM